MFGLGIEKILVLAILGLVLLGPDKLPQFAVDAARFIQKVRGFSHQAVNELKDQLGPEFANLELRDLHPKTFLANHLDDIASEGRFIANIALEDLDAVSDQVKIDPDLL
jgi:sec-independent protein translocase protein TatB